MFLFDSRLRGKRKIQRARKRLYSALCEEAGRMEAGNPGDGLERLKNRYGDLSEDQREIVDRIVAMLEHHIKMQW